MLNFLATYKLDLTTTLSVSVPVYLVLFKSSLIKNVKQNPTKHGSARIMKTTLAPTENSVRSVYFLSSSMPHINV